MALFPQDALQADVTRKEVLGWAMYDFANSGYTTVVLTAVFNAYFVGVVAGGTPWATLAWTSILAVSNLWVMLTMPVLGAWADMAGNKKRLLALCTWGCVLATAALAMVGPGDLWWAAGALVVSNVMFTYGESLIASYLPQLARPQALGRVSGWGWAFGYLGGMLALGLSLAYVLWAQSVGRSASHFVPVTMLITAAIFALASGLTLWWLRDRPVVAEGAAQAISGGSGMDATQAFKRLLQTLRHARHYRDFMALLACTVAYQAGISVVIALAAVYAEQALGFQQVDTMMLIFLVNIAAAAGAFGFGYYQDRIGHQVALKWTLWGWVLMTALAGLGQERWMFWLAAVLAGLCMGSSQSAGRAMVGLLAPVARHAEFYGLWTWAVRGSAILGPMTYGWVTWMAQGNHRAGIASTAVFFVMGLVLLARIDLVRGQTAKVATIE